MAIAERVWANHCLSILWAERGGPPTLPLADALMGELEAFRVTLTAKGHDTYAAQSGLLDRLSP